MNVLFYYPVIERDKVIIYVKQDHHLVASFIQVYKSRVQFTGYNLQISKVKGKFNSPQL